jgi:hypothetical protein
MNLGTTRLSKRPRNRWQDEVREDGRIVGGEEWQKKVHNREEWEKDPENGKELLHSAHANGMNEPSELFKVKFNIDAVFNKAALQGKKSKEFSK